MQPVNGSGGGGGGGGGDGSGPATAMRVDIVDAVGSSSSSSSSSTATTTAEGPEGHIINRDLIEKSSDWLISAISVDAKTILQRIPVSAIAYLFLNLSLK